jgi:hypothetical protein
MFEVEVRNVAGEPATVGNAGRHTLVVDRPADGGGRGLGFNGGELLYLAIAKVDEIAEIPNSRRRGTSVTLRAVRAG